MEENLTEQEQAVWAEYEKKGYDQYLEIWVLENSFPRPSSCPARYLKEGSIQRFAYIRGWNKAAREAGAM